MTEPPVIPELTPEFSRPIPVDNLGGEARVYEIEADSNECDRLARRGDLVRVKSLKASVTIEPLGREAGPGTQIVVSGNLSADVVQSCVVTLEPVENHVAETFSLTFSLEKGPLPAEKPDHAAVPGDRDRAFKRGGKETAKSGPENIDEILDDTAPEPLYGPVLDIGECVAQQFLLALDPYPRSEGVALEALNSADGAVFSVGEADSGKENPFAVLEGLKKKT